MLEYIPLKQFSERVAEGWTLASELKPGDYAAVMRAPEPPRSNKSLAASARETVRFAGYDKTEDGL